MISRMMKTLLFTFVIILFCYFRLKPILFQTIGYTYDQGRDFLKTAQIIIDRDITLIGPTTGIQGLFHGVWYYYLLTVPFLLFRGAPLGFYLFNFFVHFCTFLIFTYFLKKFFGFLTAIIISLLIACSPYFIFTSTFVGNNIFALPSFLFFLIANFFILEKKITKITTLLFLTALFLGLTIEFELALGFFLIPSYLLLIILLKKMREVFLNTKNAVFFLTGLTLTFIPRVIFEIKNGFLQTEILFNFIRTSSNQQTVAYSDLLYLRTKLFLDYLIGLFLTDKVIIFFIIFFVLFLILLFEYKVKKYYNSSVFFLSFLLLLFLMSTFYKTDFFWGNYLEVIHYLLLIIIALTISVELKTENFLGQGLKIILLAVIFIASLNSFTKNLNTKPKIEGTLAQHQQIVRYILSAEKNSNKYCVKIYTPPVIPYTYNYLFLYNHLSAKTAKPQDNWVDDRCWFIIEADENIERRTSWLKSTIPKKTKFLKQKNFAGTTVKLAIIER